MWGEKPKKELHLEFFACWSKTIGTLIDTLDWGTKNLAKNVFTLSVSSLYLVILALRIEVRWSVLSEPTPAVPQWRLLAPLKTMHQRVHCLDSCWCRRRSCLTQKSCFLGTVWTFFKGKPPRLCASIRACLNCDYCSRLTRVRLSAKNVWMNYLYHVHAGDYFILCRKQIV